ncbi:MAG: amino acid dehydrogenase [Flavobacteriales bacterium]|nr:amino acid dehydrogenase [Flavobacteriales bacterium]
MNTEELLHKFENKTPEIVFEWKDPETDAEGWIVINSLRNGSAGGGTRMRKGLNKREVESLAKTMEIKFTVAGPPIGGAKSGINFDPKDPRKKEVLKRWFKAAYPLLKHYYGTGGDLNVDEIHEVIPITAENGLLHPQEGTVNGHLKDYTPEERLQSITRLQDGVSLKITDSRFSPDVNRGYNISDMITGWGVAEAVRHYYEIWGGSMLNKLVIVQGWGNVAAAAAWYLSKGGALIAGIIDKHGGVIEPKGMTFEQVNELYLTKDGNSLHTDKLMPFEEVNEQIWKLGAEIFIPGASSRLVTESQVLQMMEGGMEVISCGANVPFADEEIFMGAISRLADSNMSVIPDFIANCGMARVFAYLMKKESQVNDVRILKDVSAIIRSAMMRVHQFNPKPTGISKKALELSLTDLV